MCVYIIISYTIIWILGRPKYWIVYAGVEFNGLCAELSVIQIIMNTE